MKMSTETEIHGGALAVIGAVSVAGAFCGLFFLQTLAWNYAVTRFGLPQLGFWQAGCLDFLAISPKLISAVARISFDAG